MMKHLDGALINLKRCVRVIESFDERFKGLDSIHSDTAAYPELH